MLSARVINFLLRGITLGCKFLLVFFLAKLLEPTDLGLYGLLVATTTYCLYVIGFEFYTYSMRELIASSKNSHAGILLNKLAFYAAAYVIFMPLLMVIFWTETLPWSLLVWFYVLLVLEHANQELNRILVALSLQIKASIVLFVRSGFWVLFIIPLMWSMPWLREIKFVLAAWCISGMLSVALAIKWIFREISFTNLLPINFNWIKKGFLVSLPMLVAAIGLQGLFVFDRHIVEWIAGLETLGAYVLFAGIGAAMISFLDAGVLVFFYPQVVKAARSKNLNDFREMIKKITINVVLSMLILSVVAYGVSVVVVSWLEKSIYAENFYLIKWIIVAMFIFGMNHIPHLGLYAQGRDRPIVLSHLTALISFIIIAVFLNSYLGIVAVPLAMCSAFTLMAVWKVLAYKKMMRELL